MRLNGYSLAHHEPGDKQEGGWTREQLVKMNADFTAAVEMPRGCGRPPRGLPGQFRAPLQLHRGLNRLDALASCSNGLTERSLEALIGFDQVRVVIRRGNRRF